MFLITISSIFINIQLANRRTHAYDGWLFAIVDVYYSATAGLFMRVVLQGVVVVYGRTALPNTGA